MYDVSEHLMDVFDHIRVLAVDQPLPTLDVPHLDDAVCEFKDATAHGMDTVGPRFIKHLPYEGRAAVCDMFNGWTYACALPWQMLLNLVVLIPKPGGGERPIALLNFFLRLFLRCHKPLSRRWCRDRAGEWDAAVEGSSSLGT